MSLIHHGSQLSVHMNSDKLDDGSGQPADNDQQTRLEPRMFSGSTPLCTRRLAPRATAMYIGFLTMGMTTAMIGITLLEIQVQLDVSLGRLSLLFSWAFVGRLLSSVTSSRVFDRIHPELQLGVVMFVSSLATITFPFMKSYYAVSVLVSIQGFTHGYMSTGSSAHCFYIWKEKAAPFLQAVHLVFAIGCLLTSIIAGPFATIERDTNTLKDQNKSGLCLNETENMMLMSSEQNVQPSDYMILNYSVHGSLGLHNDMDSNSSHACTTHNQSQEISFTHSGVYHSGTFYPYLIVGTLQAILTIPFVVQFSLDKCVIKRTTQIVRTTEVPKTNILVVFVFCLLSFCCDGIETVFGGFLYTYAIMYLKWDAKMGNRLVTVFWASFTGARVVAVFIVGFLSAETILNVMISLLLISAITMASAGHLSPAVVWITTATYAISTSTQLSSILVLAGKYMHLSGHNMSILMASVFLSGISLPPLTGYLFLNVDMQWFIYIQVVLSGIQASTYVMFRIFSRRIVKPNLFNSVNLSIIDRTEKPTDV